MLISAPVEGTLGNNLISVIDLGLAEPVEITKLDNVWVLDQLIHWPTWAKNQL